MSNTTNYTLKEEIGFKLINLNEKNYFKSDDGKKIIGKLKKLLATARSKSELEALKSFVYQIDKMNDYNDLNIMVNSFNKSFNIYREPEEENVMLELKVNSSRNEISNEIKKIGLEIRGMRNRADEIKLQKDKNALQRFINSYTKKMKNLEKIRDTQNKNLINRESKKIIKIRLLNKINSIKNKYEDNEIVNKLMKMLSEIKDFENFYYFENFLDGILYHNNANDNKKKILNAINDYCRSAPEHIEHL